LVYLEKISPKPSIKGLENMLIRFFVENFSSFGAQTEFSLVAGRQQIHPEHLIKAPENDLKILRAGVIYGANASGKSNLIKAMAFARDLIVVGTAPMSRILVRPFLLDLKLRSLPSVFQFTFCNNGTCYTYGFKATAEKVLEEWLFEVKNEKEIRIFERTTNNEGDAIVEFAPSLTKTKDDESFLGLIARGTRSNQLFLTESIQRNVKQFQDAWGWFAKHLVIIFPDSRALGIEFAFKDKDKIAPLFMKILQTFDTGIVGIETHDQPLESAAPDLPANMKADLEQTVRDEKTNVFIAGPKNMRYAVHRNEKGDLLALKLRAQHAIRGTGESISFDFSEESDGTQRMVDLLPAMTSLLSENKVVIVDEIDRSLHPHVTYALFDLFLSQGIQCKSQLIATTHAENLLTFDLLRKDEIWFVKKNNDGESSLFSLEEFNPRYDKDIMTGYMNGRFGAVPTIMKSPNPILEEVSAHVND
jgi:AAA15 family ATPase/GTPase